MDSSTDTLLIWHPASWSLVVFKHYTTFFSFQEAIGPTPWMLWVHSFPLPSDYNQLDKPGRGFIMCDYQLLWWAHARAPAQVRYVMLPHHPETDDEKPYWVGKSFHRCMVEDDGTKRRLTWSPHYAALTVMGLTPSIEIPVGPGSEYSRDELLRSLSAPEQMRWRWWRVKDAWFSGYTDASREELLELDPAWLDIELEVNEDSTDGWGSTDLARSYLDNLSIVAVGDESLSELLRADHYSESPLLERKLHNGSVGSGLTRSRSSSSSVCRCRRPNVSNCILGSDQLVQN